MQAAPPEETAANGSGQSLGESARDGQSQPHVTVHLTAADAVDLFQEQDEGGHNTALRRNRILHSEIWNVFWQLSAWDKARFIVSSDYYELGITVLIVLSVLFIALRVQYNGFDAGYQLDYGRMYDEPAAQEWPGADSVLQWSNYVFLSIFTIDVVIRIIVLRWKFFRVVFNWLDFIVVAAGWSEVFIKFRISPLVLRMLRLVKFGRAQRVLRNPRMMESLNVMLRCVVVCTTCLLWSAVMILGISCIGGMVLSILVIYYMSDSANPLESRRAVFRYYGTFGRTLLTMFEILFANWSPACRVLTENVSEWFALYFVLYRCLAGFAVLNVVNAVFIQQTMRVAQQDDELMLDAKENQQKTYGSRLIKLFEELDSSGDGSLNRNEFNMLKKDPKLKSIFSLLEIDPDDMEDLWNCMDDGDGMIRAQEFCDGAVRMKGAARGLDMVGLVRRVKRLEKLVQGLDDRIRAKNAVQNLGALVYQPA